MSTIEELYKEKKEQLEGYRVQSSTDPNWYWNVRRRNDGSWYCDCPGYKMHCEDKPNYQCRHIKYIISQKLQLAQ